MRYRMYFHETTSVTQKCYDRTIRLRSVFPKPVEAWQFSIMTAPVPIQCHVRTSRHEKSTWRRIHQTQPWRGSCLVDIVSSGFLCSYSLHISPSHSFSLFLLLQPASSSAPCMPKTPGELASLVRISQTPRCFPHGGARAEDPRWRDKKERRTAKKRSVAPWTGW